MSRIISLILLISAWSIDSELPACVDSTTDSCARLVTTGNKKTLASDRHYSKMKKTDGRVTQRVDWATNCNDNWRSDEARWKLDHRRVAGNMALPREGTRTRTGLLYEYLSLRVVFSALHCTLCRDNELFKVTGSRVLLLSTAFSPRGPRASLVCGERVLSDCTSSSKVDDPAH